MKAYTDIEQSKKLAEILPLESADMHYNNVSIKGINYIDEHRAELMEYNRAITLLSKYTINPLFEIIPCWSLAALLSVFSLPKLELDEQEDGERGWFVSHYTDDYRYDSYYRDEPIDACYDLILKLKEKDLI